MDWVKIKSEHISAEYSDAQVGALVRFQLLVARLKRMPTDKEIAREVSKKNWTSLVVVLSSFGVDPKLVSNKVLEDVKLVENRRRVSRETSRQNRHKNKELGTNGDMSRDLSRDKQSDVHVTSLEKRREEKKKNNDDNKKIFDQEKVSSSFFIKLCEEIQKRDDHVEYFSENPDEAKLVAKFYTKTQKKLENPDKYERSVYLGLTGKIEWDICHTIDSAQEFARGSIATAMRVHEKEVDDENKRLDEKRRESLNKSIDDRFDELSKYEQVKINNQAFKNARMGLPVNFELKRDNPSVKSERNKIVQEKHMAQVKDKKSIAWAVSNATKPALLNFNPNDICKT